MIVSRFVLLVMVVVAISATETEPTCTVTGCNCTDSIDVVLDECTQVTLCGEEFFMTLYTESQVGVFWNDSRCTFGDGTVYNATCDSSPPSMPDISVTTCRYPNDPTPTPSTPVPHSPATLSPTASPSEQVTCLVTSCDCSDSYSISSDSCGEFTFCNESYNLMLLGEERMAMFSDSRCSSGDQIWEPSCAVNVSNLPNVELSNCAQGPTAAPMTEVPHTMTPHVDNGGDSNSARTAGIVGGCIAGVLALIAAVYFCRGRKRPEMREPVSRHLFEESIDPNGVEVN